eukprot:scaffold1542_cov49-Attheya_sp.AAC.3
MANTNNNNNAGGQEQEAPNEVSLVETVLRFLFLFMAMQYVMTTYINPPAQVDTISGTRVPAGVTLNNKGAPYRSKGATCLWPAGTELSLHMHVSESPTAADGDISKNSWKKKQTNYQAEWNQDGWNLFGEAQENWNVTRTVTLGPSLWNNASHLYAHIYLRRLNSNNNDDDNGAVFRKVIPLTKYRTRKRIRDEKNLLSDTSSYIGGSSIQKENTTTQVDTDDSLLPSDGSVLTKASLNRSNDQMLLYLKPSLTLEVVEVTMNFPSRERIPPQFSKYMDWYNESHFYPILYSSEFWITKDQLQEVNGTLHDSTIDIQFEKAKMWKWQLMSQMEESWTQQEKMSGEEDGTSDMLRTMLLETNPYLLGITAIVSVLHTLLDILAFKNDISFFKGKKSMEGLSLRSMVINVFFQIVILLYLADNETSYMVLMSNGVGLLIEIWKITTAVKISFKGGRIQWVEATSYSKSKTKKYDEIATSHLLFITMPLVAGYGMYSLLHQRHKGWHSWVLNTLVGFIYMFGFVMMTPQLQSVAHLNWRTMTYKSVNTFIDDLFAFVIKMPIMHRLACLRDDVVFFVYLYQRWAYRVDYTRVNEFGQCIQPTEEMLLEKKQEEEETAAKALLVSSPSSVAPNTTEETSIRQRRGARDK